MSNGFWALVLLHNKKIPHTGLHVDMGPLRAHLIIPNVRFLAFFNFFVKFYTAHV